jgi:hypothetical protein
MKGNVLYVDFPLIRRELAGYVLIVGVQRDADKKG